MELESTMSRQSGGTTGLYDGEMLEERLAWNDKIEDMRQYEYPMLQGVTYLDHAGTALYAKSLIEAFSADMMSSLVGNPHSTSTSSMSMAHRIENVRLKVLSMFNASPDSFDVVFVANATAGIKLVADAFRDREGGFWYGYHKDSHTSLVGLREIAKVGSHCFASDAEAEQWIQEGSDYGDRAVPTLFAYPGQSNMNGRRLPLDWPRKIRQSRHENVYSLFDAAGLLSTTPLDLSNPEAAPDFTVLSFYKIFGFPDLGALIVRKDSGQVFENRKYFGGGTVEMVSTFGEQWHEVKQSSFHAGLEDGTLPIRGIMALDSAIDVHQRLYGGLDQISKHTSFLAKRLYDRLATLKHWNNAPVCYIYKDETAVHGDSTTQGGTVTFNLLDDRGAWRSNHEANKLAIIKNIHIRTGTMCNPGGMAAAIGLSSAELKSHFAAGFRCGGENDVRDDKPLGMIRASLGAMSTLKDVDNFVCFIKEFFVDKQLFRMPLETGPMGCSEFAIESITIYPVKSFGGWQVPPDVPWTVKLEGLAWDRQWCLVHRGTMASMSQKRCPRMTLFKPSLDLSTNTLRVAFEGPVSENVAPSIDIALDQERNDFIKPLDQTCSTNVCGDKVQPRIYASPEITNFFSTHLQTPCHLAWLPSSSSSTPHRVAKLLSRPQKQSSTYSADPKTMPGAFPTPPPSLPRRPLLLANESPILAISRASVDQINRLINEQSDTSNTEIRPEVFRANIVLGPRSKDGKEIPFIEESWHSMRIRTRERGPDTEASSNSESSNSNGEGLTQLQVLGPCRRCQMVCIDQKTGERGQEPFATLAKTRARDGGVWFGIHCGIDFGSESGLLMVGDLVDGIPGG